MYVILITSEIVTKKFKPILDAKPYGDVGVIKSECVGNVEKRMESCHRNIISNFVERQNIIKKLSVRNFKV